MTLQLQPKDDGSQEGCNQQRQGGKSSKAGRKSCLDVGFPNPNELSIQGLPWRHDDRKANQDADEVKIGLIEGLWIKHQFSDKQQNASHPHHVQKGSFPNFPDTEQFPRFYDGPGNSVHFVEVVLNFEGHLEGRKLAWYEPTPEQQGGNDGDGQWNRQLCVGLTGLNDDHFCCSGWQEPNRSEQNRQGPVHALT